MIHIKLNIITQKIILDQPKLSDPLFTQGVTRFTISGDCIDDQIGKKKKHVAKTYSSYICSAFPWAMDDPEEGQLRDFVSVQQKTKSLQKHLGDTLNKVITWFRS